MVRHAMVIYRIPTRRSNKGTHYYTHVLASSARPFRRGPSRLVKHLNLGSSYPFPQRDWKLICDLLEDRLQGQQNLDLRSPVPIEIQREVANLARRMAQKGGQKSGCPPVGIVPVTGGPTDE